MNDNKRNTIVAFDIKNSIILGNYLDIIMNDESASNNSIITKGCIKKYTHTNNIVFQGDIKKATRLNQYEHIIYGEGNDIPENYVFNDNLDNNNDYFVYSGGIKLPSSELCTFDEGSGNILIVGEPGVGKSTLAFQFAAACTSDYNNGIAVYYSLDMDSRLLSMSMKRDNHEEKEQFKVNFLRPINNANTKNDVDSLRAILQINNTIPPQILMPQLSPRGISANTNERDHLFQKRFEELETIVKAARKYNEQCKDNDCKIKLFVIDSLNNFGEKTLKHEQIHRIFSLFKRNKIVGVFTLGKFDNDYIEYESVDMSAAQFLSDVIINLTKTHVHDYNVTYLEVKKSRHIKHVLGRHMYKIAEYNGDNRKECHLLRNPFPDLKLKKEISVLPSLHYFMFGTEGLGNAIKKKEKEVNLFGIDKMETVLPSHFEWGKDNDRKTSKIISLVGNSGLYKSDLAIGALISGIHYENCNGLIIRMADKDNLKTRGVRLSTGLLDELAKYKCNMEDKYIDDEGNAVDTVNLFQQGVYRAIKPHKYILSGWSLNNKDNNNNDITSPQLLEVIFKSGALTPETFIKEISEIIHAYKIGRIAIMDLKLMETSYPFLVESPTSGRLFLPALVHIMRNYGIDVIFTASNSEYVNKNSIVDQLCKLSDATIRCNYEQCKDKSNDNKKIKPVKLFGEGLITNHCDVSINLAYEGKKLVKHNINFHPLNQEESNTLLKDIEAFKLI